MTARGLWVLVGILILALLIVIGTRKEARAEAVSAAVVLAMDFSSSMTAREKEWQIDALVEIFGNPDIEDRIGLTYRGAVAVCAIRFANSVSPPFIPWTILRQGDGSVQRFREALAAEQQRVHARQTPSLTDGTYISRGILAGIVLLENMDADRKVVDVQTDGFEGEGPASLTLLARIDSARDAAEAAGVTVNVLVVGNPQSRQFNLLEYHEEHTVTSTGRVWDATTYESYLLALQTKLLLELF